MVQRKKTNIRLRKQRDVKSAIVPCEHIGQTIANCDLVHTLESYCTKVRKLCKALANRFSHKPTCRCWERSFLTLQASSDLVLVLGSRASPVCRPSSQRSKKWCWVGSVACTVAVAGTRQTRQLNILWRGSGPTEESGTSTWMTYSPSWSTRRLQAPGVNDTG